MNAPSSALEDRVKNQLGEVLDPCSTFTERPQSIIDLGLVDSIAIDDGHVIVDLLPTNQFCMYIPHMTEEIENRIGALSEVDSVSVDVVSEKVWTRDRMSAEARAEREAYFESRVEAHEVTPAYDGESWSDEVRTSASVTDDR